MTAVGAPERATQDRIVLLFENELGYTYLGRWEDREGNSNIEEDLLVAFLAKKKYSTEKISRAIHTLRTTAQNPNLSLYDNNKNTYKWLRYGSSIKVAVGENHDTVNYIDFENPENNDFAIAEEVTLRGQRERRPDIVLYINGIAIGVLELKNSRVSIGNGIRQNISNQDDAFNKWFFGTVQFVFAGSDSEGLQYGTIKTPEKYFLQWKEEESDNTRYKLDKYLGKMCSKKRIIELIRDFVIFDGGIKKLPRAHQYFGIKAAQERVAQNAGGVIWHTQGSGKSIVMVLLAKWLLEARPAARVVIVTDRDELDDQIARVFGDAGETIKRAQSGKDLLNLLAQAKPRLMCSLVHKFGKRGVENFDEFIKELQSQESKTVGDIFVFVDECHRTQSGKLHRTMKAILPKAVFIGFTGTPLLKEDKQTSLEVFGSYIHTYKFSEAVADGVVLDLVYEARDIDQKLASDTQVDAWFDAKTKGLNDWQKAALREEWGNMQRILSCRSRMERVVRDIGTDFGVKPRLNNDRGTAILVASSIYEACRYFELFQNTAFKNKCAIVTSYNPQAKDITEEDTGENTRTDREFIYETYRKILDHVEARPDKTKAETYEDNAKKLFIEQPANMKLLIVVDKLLTGFDAPSCTYIYFDKSMRDHGLFQAICRTNRLDGEDKDFGYIVDYKDLFKKVETAIAVYASELDHTEGGADPSVLLQDRLSKGREKLDNALEGYSIVREPVPAPKDQLAHIIYFCGNTELPADLDDKAPRRELLYKAVSVLVRAFANLADEMDAAGYSKNDVETIRKTVDQAAKLRETIRNASGENLDLKPYEADMRHLLDTYIDADLPRRISPFDANTPLLELIVKIGAHEAVKKQLPGEEKSQATAAEVIENNVRARILKDQHNDPAFYAKMSALLDEIIKKRKANAESYEKYLAQIAELARQLVQGQEDTLPASINTAGKRALFNNLGSDEELALKIDEAMRTKRPDGWLGVEIKERVVKGVLYDILHDLPEVERIFSIIKAQREYL